MHARVPLTPHLAPPRRSASVAASLLVFSVHAGASGAVVGYVTWGNLWVLGGVVKGVGGRSVVGTGWGAAHVVVVWGGLAVRLGGWCRGWEEERGSGPKEIVICICSS